MSVLCNYMSKNDGVYFYIYRGRKIYEPPRYMSVNQAAQQLLEIVQNRRVGGEEPGTPDLLKALILFPNHYPEKVV